MRPNSLRERVETRANRRCEYCHAPQDACGYRFHIEHIVPLILGGLDEEANFAMACATCNLAKSKRITAPDPLTQETVAVFHPRTQIWQKHFRWDIPQNTLVGLTPTGRATVNALDMNNELQQLARQLWFEVGLLP